jgi:hypothetical protein
LLLSQAGTAITEQAGGEAVDLNGDGDTDDYILTADVEAWADLWFYANPIFIEVVGDDHGDGDKGKKRGKKDDKKRVRKDV